jgi:hypothetical protein
LRGFPLINEKEGSLFREIAGFEPSIAKVEIKEALPMNQPDLLLAILAASLVDGFHKNDPGYKPLLPTGKSQPSDSASNWQNPCGYPDDPYHTK